MTAVMTDVFRIIKQRIAVFAYAYFAVTGMVIHIAVSLAYRWDKLRYRGIHFAFVYSVCNVDEKINSFAARRSGSF